MNAQVGTGTYAGMEEDAFGTGGTKSVIFYRTTTLSPVTDLFVIDDFPFQRPHITQGFQVNADGRRFLFSTAHMRSKLCDNATGGNVDQNDGQGCFNSNRRDQANALVAHWEGLRNSTGIAAQTGRSYGFVHRVLSESGATLRGRGGATRGKKKA